jgi:hypothetical protein
MRRSHQEIQELVAARVTDFVEGNASEDVTRASLKALNVSPSEINHLMSTAFKVYRNSINHDLRRMQESITFLDKYLKR